MPRAKKKKLDAVTAPVRKRVRGGQRQRLIDACIGALHIYGPSRTTVEKVVDIAKMSPGIVRFYFKSKAAMLVAALQFLAAEFEDQVLVPVGRLKSTPVAALELLVALYLDPEIASPRKVSVWYAFWGEASSRQEYYDICGQKDERFAQLVRELIEGLIQDTSRQHLDADGIALGLIGVLEILWQDFAFKSEADIDRAAATSRCRAFLRSVFPGNFGVAAQPEERSALPLAALAPWVYDSRRLFMLERERIFNSSWQVAGHGFAVATPGAFIALDLANERVLLVRDERGVLRAFRNSCTETPHALVTRREGELKNLGCRVHGTSFGLDGVRLDGRGYEDLFNFEVRTIGDLVLVKTSRGEESNLGWAGAWADLDAASGSRLLFIKDRVVAADWKLVIECWLDAASLGAAQSEASVRRFLGPNHWFDGGRDGFTVTQVLPSAPGVSVVREYTCSFLEDERAARVGRYLASRVSLRARSSVLDLAASTQSGMITFGNHSSREPLISPHVAEFRRSLIDIIPVMSSSLGPADP